MTTGGEREARTENSAALPQKGTNREALLHETFNPHGDRQSDLRVADRASANVTRRAESAPLRAKESSVAIQAARADLLDDGRGNDFGELTQRVWLLESPAELPDASR